MPTMTSRLAHRFSSGALGLAQLAIVAATAAAATSALAQSVYTQNIPLKLPRGVGGTQPDLAFTYSSAGGNGMMGMGWQLSGLAVITRVNHGNGIGYAGADTYAHSQLGVLVRQADGTYRSKDESFVKVVPSGTCGDGPCSWTAYHPSGLRSYYGFAANSQLLLQGTASVRTWGIDRVIDLFGNSYEVAYHNDAVYGVLYPWLVTYNKAANVSSSGYRTVELSYETRTDTEAGYYQSAFQQTNQRLKLVTIKSGGALVRKYRLDYECGTASTVGCPQPSTGRSRLKGIVEIGSDGVSELPGPTFQYGVGGSGYTQAAGFAPPQAFRARGSGVDFGYDRGFRTADLNGDGFVDLIQGFYEYGTRFREAWLNTGSAWAKADPFAPPTTTDDLVHFAGRDSGAVTGWDAGLRLVDLNGDGRPDLIQGWYNYGTYYQRAWLNNGGNCSTKGCAWTLATQYAPPRIFSARDDRARGGWESGTRLADLDGDGKPDLIHANQDGAGTSRGAWLNTGTGWVESTALAPPAGYYFAARALDSGDNAGHPAGLQILDVNGDGRADLLFGYASASCSGATPVVASTRLAWINSGAGWVSRAAYAPAIEFGGGIRSTGGTWQWWNSGYAFEDVNADGKPDLLGGFLKAASVTCRTNVDNQTTRALSYNHRGAWLNTGLGWTSFPGFSPPADIARADGVADAGARFLDLNGDGRPDMVLSFWDQGSFLRSAWINTGSGWAQDSAHLPPAHAFAGKDSSGAAWRDSLDPIDLDGDGRPDYLMASSVWGTNYNSAWLGSRAVPDLMAVSSNGVGGRVDVLYMSAVQLLSVSRASTSRGVSNTSPRPLVYQLISGDGQGGVYTTRYGYQDGRILPGRIPDQRDLGFAATTITDAQTGQVSRSYVDQQTPGLEGRVVQTESYDANGLLRSRTTFGFTVSSPNPGTELALETSRVVKTLERSGTVAQEVSSQTTLTAYDAFGNPTEKRQQATGLPEVIVKTSFTNDTSNWILGRVAWTWTESGGVELGRVVNTWGPAATGQLANVVTEKWEKLIRDGAYVQFLTTRMTYDVNGNLATATDPLGRIATTTFDTTFRAYAATVTNALGHVTSTVHNAAGLPTSVTDANGNVTSTTYDAFGRPLQETRPDGGTTTYYHGLLDDGGSPARTIGRYAGAVSTIDATRTVTQQEHFDGVGFKYLTLRTGNCPQWDAVHTLKDAAGRPSRTSLPFCSGTSPAYSTTVFDEAGRVTSVTTPDGMVARTAYGFADASKPAAAAVWRDETDQAGRTTRRYLDARDRVVRIRDAAGGNTDYGYDPLGRLTSVTLPNGAVTTVAYDSLNRKLRVVDPQLGATSYVYDLVGNPLTVTTAGKTTTFTYDALNRVTSKTPQGEPAVTYAYDFADFSNSKGRLTSLDTAAVTMWFSYKPAGQLNVVMRWVEGASYSVRYDYDQLGRTTKLLYPDGSLAEYAYTPAGQHSQLKLNGAVVATWSNFTASGRPGKVDLANQVSTSYGYDVMTHLTSVDTRKGTGPALQALTYDWYGTSIPGLEPTFGLEVSRIADNRPSTIALDGANTSDTQAFKYDALHRLTQAVGVWGTKSYGYDSVGNMTGFGGLVNRAFTYTGQQAVSGTGFGATYDLAGNMTQRVVDGVTWEYGWTAENRLASAKRNGVVTTQMAYDADGGRIRKLYTPASGPAVTTLYLGNLYEKRTYSDATPQRHTLHLFANGQLVSSVTREGNIATAFNNPFEWRNSWSRAQAYGGGSALGAVKKAGHYLAAVASHPFTLRWAFPAAFAVLTAALLAVFLAGLRRARAAVRGGHPLWLRGAALPLVVAFAFTGCSAIPDGEGGARIQTGGPHYLISGDTTNGPALGTYYYHRNHLNSSSVVTDSTGSEVTRMVYLPYGELSKTNSSGGDKVTSKFTGQEYDAETGLYNYGARYYDPSIGRFVSADTVVPDVRDAQAWNRYAYARDNPVLYTDPTGHSFWSWLGDVFSAIGNALSAFVSFVGAALMWIVDIHIAAIKFLGKAATYAWETIKGMAQNPMGMALFLMGVAMSLAVPGAGLLMVLVKASVPIVATSLARAAGISDPLILGIIGLAAGLAVNGAKVGDWLKAGAKFGAERIILPRLPYGLGMAYSLADFAMANAKASASGKAAEGGSAPTGEEIGRGSVQQGGEDDGLIVKAAYDSKGQPCATQEETRLAQVEERWNSRAYNRGAILATAGSVILGLAAAATPVGWVAYAVGILGGLATGSGLGLMARAEYNHTRNDPTLNMPPCPVPPVPRA